MSSITRRDLLAAGSLGALASTAVAAQAPAVRGPARGPAGFDATSPRADFAGGQFYPD